MMAVLPENVFSLEDNGELLKGPFSSLNFLWQDDTEVLSNTSLQSKLGNIDTQNLVQQYVQLHDNIKEEKTAHVTQLHHEISEMTSHIKILEFKLKEDNKEPTDSDQKKVDDQLSLKTIKEEHERINDLGSLSDTEAKLKCMVSLEEETVHVTQLNVEISEMTSRMKILKMENVKLKEDNKKLTRHFGQKKAKDQMSTSLLQESKMSEDVPEILDKSRKPHQSQNEEITIHQLMNIVPLIQEKWSLIGTRLKLSSDKLDDIWHTAGQQQISADSKNTFCCVKMLTSWYKTSDNVSVDAIIMAIDAPHVGLRTKISTIKAALISEYVNIDSDVETSVTNPPQELKQPYVDMITEFCLDLSKSQHSISDILVYLKVCNIDSEVVKDILDYPELVRSFERHELLNKTDLSWLKNIAHHAQCAKATEIIEKYESSLIADKIPWYSSHPKGTYLVGRTDKKPESVTIKDSSNAKSAASRIINIKETDIVLDSSEVGSVTFYWKLINKSFEIEIPEVANASLIKECRNAGLTDVGIINDGNLNWADIDDEIEMFVGLYDFNALEAGDLSFKESERLQVVDAITSKWWKARSLVTNMEGYIPSNYVAPVQSIQKQDWFFDNIKHINAEKLLLMEGNVTGTFLVRKSESHPGNYFLSVRNDDNVQHYLIRKIIGNFYISPQQTFATLNDLVQHYSRDANKLCTQLSVPCPKRIPDDWEIEHKCIKLKGKLYDGEFSEVWAGTWNDTIPVAVKTPKPGSMAIFDFFAEAQIVKKLRHDMLIEVYGVCTQEKPFYIVTELMKHGNLLDYLTKGEGQHLKLPQLMDIAAQVANGMAYLESQGYIHRNLCASNVLVEEGNVVKIGDFGLACPLVYGTYTVRIEEKNLVRWMAPEAITLCHFTIKSDIWSYGVLLTELVTHDHIPYPRMTNDEVLAQVKQGYRMPRPYRCPDPLYQIMLECWKTDPKERPTFKYLEYWIENFAAEEEDFDYVDNLFGDERIQKTDWFFDKIKRTDANKLLLMEGNVTGTFLVRKSERHVGDYALSVRYCDTVYHYRIEIADTGDFYIHPLRERFSTLDKLIHHFSRGAHGLRTCLTVSCPRIKPSTTVGSSYNTKDDRGNDVELKCKIFSEKPFSEVWEGIWNSTTPVRIKMLKPGSISVAVSDFLIEVQIMMKLQHEKIIPLYGVCTQKAPFYIVTELMKYGSLLDYLTKGEGQHLKLPELMDIGAQVANGMAYLESQDYIHRDLCALNVLVGEENIVKVGDFGLARRLVDGKYSTRGEKVPTRWTAPEVFLLKQFTVKSDVWSYGVFLTELVTRGRVPYPGMTNDEVLAQVKQGYHMPLPPECPDPLYQIMLECWKTDPKERPTFEYLWKATFYQKF